VGLNPIAQIDIGQSPLSGRLQLPENGKAAQAAPGQVGVEKAVNRRQSIFQPVDHGHGQQALLIPEMDHGGVGPFRLDKALKVLFIPVCHGPPGVAAGLIALIKGKGLGMKGRVPFLNAQILIVFPATTIPPLPIKFLTHYADGNTGGATLAMGPVEIVAAAPKTDTGKGRVVTLATNGTGLYHDIPGQKAFPIGAGLLPGNE